MTTDSEKIYRRRAAKEKATRREADHQQQLEQRQNQQVLKQRLIREIHDLLPDAIAILDATEWEGAARKVEVKYTFIGRRRFYSAPGVLIYSGGCDCTQACRCTSSNISLGVDHSFYENSKVKPLEGLYVEALKGIRDGLQAILSREE